MRGLADLSRENWEDNIFFLLSSCLVLLFEECGRRAEGAYTLFIPTSGEVSGKMGGLTAGGCKIRWEICQTWNQLIIFKCWSPRSRIVKVLQKQFVLRWLYTCINKKKYTYYKMTHGSFLLYFLLSPGYMFLYFYHLSIRIVPGFTCKLTDCCIRGIHDLGRRGSRVAVWGLGLTLLSWAFTCFRFW